MEELLGIIVQIAFWITIPAIGYFFGKKAEKKHYHSIKKRERKFASMPAVTLKNAFDVNKTIISSELVSGSVVISIDYFKRLYAGLINFFGGEMASYESLIDRARREAILRMKEQSPSASLICNMRIETSSISKGTGKKRSVGSVEAIVYGTAVTYAASSTTPPPMAEPSHHDDFVFGA